jgi:hypothetical protein
MKDTRYVFLIVVVALMTFSPSKSFSQGMHPQIEEWYERGQYNEVVNAVVPDPSPYPHSVYVAARSLLQLDRPAEARAQYERLLAVGGAWYWMGLSGMRHLDGDYSAAVDAAGQAVAAEWFDLTLHHYGWVLPLIDDYYTSAWAFTNAILMHPNYTWSYWYSGKSNYEIWQRYGDTEARDRFYRHWGCFVTQLNDRDPKPGEYWAAVSIVGSSPGCVP